MERLVELARQTPLNAAGLEVSASAPSLAGLETF